MGLFQRPVKSCFGTADNFFMKLAMKRWGVFLLIPLILGVSSGGVVELQGYFNARYSANFLKSTRNVKFVMPPGTRGKIEETKQFASGNYGLKVEVLSGKHKGEKVWVYYKPSDPGMKLFENTDAAGEALASADVEKARSAETTRKTEALRVPAAAEKAEEKQVVQELNQQIRDANKKVQETKPCDGCEVAKEQARDTVPNDSAKVVSTFAPRSSSDAPVLRSPTRTVNPFGIRPTRCRTLGTYDSCIFEGDSSEGKFKLRNMGPNKIVSKGEYRIREWSFEYEAGARQDIGISISDSPNATVSHTQESYIMLFPRKTLPHIRVEGNRQIVTLPTGETVTYNAQTREVIGGAFSEDGPMTGGGKILAPAKVSYRGNGVMVRVDRRGEEPRLLANGTATVTKQGKSCKVPVRDLWPNQAQNSPVHFKYFSDSDFDSYLKRKCGFGL